MFHRRLVRREIFRARRELAFLLGRRLCGLLLSGSRGADYASVSVELKRFERRMARVRDARERWLRLEKTLLSQANRNVES